MDTFYDAKSANNSDFESISEISDSSDDDISELSDDELNKINVNNILNNPIHKDDIYEIHITSSKNLLQIEKQWPYNRELNINHYKKIARDLEKMEKPHLMSPFIFVKDSMDSYIIIDGQHRIKAIHEIMLNNPDFIMNVEIKVYYVNDCNYDPEISILFKKVNSNKNVKNSNIPSKIILDAIENLITNFPKKILKKKKGQRVNHPNITQTELYNIIRDSNIVIEFNLDEKKLTNIICEYNKKCCKLPFDKLFPIENKKNKELYNRAKKNEFFLGLKRGANRTLIHDWIYEIKNSLKNSSQ